MGREGAPPGPSIQAAEVGSEKRVYHDMRCDLVKLCGRLIREDSGQDLVEYALLTGIVTISSILIFTSIRTKMGLAYVSWESTGQVRWSPDDPITP